MLKLFKFLTMMILLMGFAGCGPDEAAKNVPAPDISLPLEASGPPTRLSSLRGKVVLLDFWATWCGPCKMSMPDLETVYNRYRDKGVVVIGIAEDTADTSAQIPATRKDLGVTYPTVLASDIPGVADSFPHTGIPMLFIVDKKGNVADAIEGYDTLRGLARVEDRVEELLQE